MPQVTLNISRAENGNSLVVVNGQGFFGGPANATVGVRVKGDDTWFDETLFPLKLGFPGHVSQQGNFVMSDTVPTSKLNEDWGQDEVYALVNVQGYGEFRTNTIKGYF